MINLWTIHSDIFFTIVTLWSVYRLYIHIYFIPLGHCDQYMVYTFTYIYIIRSLSYSLPGTLKRKNIVLINFISNHFWHQRIAIFTVQLTQNHTTLTSTTNIFISLKSMISDPGHEIKGESHCTKQLSQIVILVSQVVDFVSSQVVFLVLSEIALFVFSWPIAFLYYYR